MEQATARQEADAVRLQAASERSGGVSDGVELPSGDRAHDHELPITAPHWYATVHGEAGALAQVFAIDGSGALFWKGERVTREQAAERFAEAGRQRPQPEVYLRADQNVPYRHVAMTLADASRAGLTRLGFVSEPPSAQLPP
jgi:biopolymer transport protein ExbD